MAQDRLQDRARSESVISFSPFIKAWVGKELGITFDDKTACIGKVIDGKLVCGVVYHNYKHPDVVMSIATIDKRWATKQFLSMLFKYPFNQLEVERVTAYTYKPGVGKFLERLGFTLEGTMRKGSEHGDVYIYGMLRDECGWLGV